MQGPSSWVILVKKIRVSGAFYAMGAENIWVMSVSLWEPQKYEYIDDELAMHRYIALWCYP